MYVVHKHGGTFYIRRYNYTTYIIYVYVSTYHHVCTLMATGNGISENSGEGRVIY